MEFKKKLRVRMWSSVAMALIGAAMAFITVMTKNNNDYMFSFGIGLLAVGIVKTIKHIKLMLNSERIKQQEIAEKDERNIAINEKAKSAAFSIYIMLSFFAIIAFQLAGKNELSTLTALSVCALTLIYTVCYYYYAKKY